MRRKVEPKVEYPKVCIGIKFPRQKHSYIEESFPDTARNETLIERAIWHWTDTIPLGPYDIDILNEIRVTDSLGGSHFYCLENISFDSKLPSFVVRPLDGPSMEWR